MRALSTEYYKPNQIDSALKYVFGIDTQLIDDGTYYIVETGGVISGCGRLSMRNTLYGGDQHKGSLENLLDPKTDFARIRFFFVHPDYAIRGIGRQIIEFCEMEAKKNGFSRMEVGANFPGGPLYKAMVFLETDYIVELFSDGERFQLVGMNKAI